MLGKLYFHVQEINSEIVLFQEVVTLRSASKLQCWKLGWNLNKKAELTATINQVDQFLTFYKTFFECQNILLHWHQFCMKNCYGQIQNADESVVPFKWTNKECTLRDSGGLVIKSNIWTSRPLLFRYKIGF